MKSVFNFFFKRFYPIRYARHIGVKVGENCRLINVSYGSEAYLIKLGNHVSATAVHFETHDGGVWVLRGEQPEIDVVKPIIVGNNVFIGYGAVILPGVKIGNNVVIGAHAVVSKDIPDDSIAVGMPARVIKNLSDYKQKALDTGNKTKGLSFTDKKIFYKEKYSMLTN